MEIKNIKLNNTSIEYITFGKGNQTLVILPGLSINNVLLNKEEIEKAYSLLTDDYTIYLFNDRDDIPDNYTISDMANDIVEAIKQLKLKDIYLFGVSKGGMLAQIITINNPKLIKKLIIASSTSRIDDINKDNFNKLKSLAINHDTQELCLSLYKMIYPENIYNQYIDAIKELSKTITDKELDKFIKTIDALKTFDITNELNKIKCPTFIFGNKDDNIFDIEITLDLISNLKIKENDYYIYDGYGHASYDLAPDFKERLLEFLNK